MNFRKTSEGGRGGSFPIQKISLRFFGKGKRYGHRFPGKSATLFSENRVGGSEAVWKFSENSSNMVEIVVPYQETQDQLPDRAAPGQGAALQSVLELISSYRCRGVPGLS